ncbi:metalloregulator ArsR/SmtB family transcription factor [Cytophagaceae bacterium DM2B3-1]|uniref:Metalloregulator ArsR/SmtB family transcription factor n=2 Tax=Xanthocytophaga TaxID=3078918 RepID=A0AAE3QTK0_9BACT|nr:MULTISPECIES: metalloregulator ArsR/SmtB family transcription factor [Xanthocytophaga]MDJ1470464.1 metalloregulator ArsR/SmtB family transcription factor [Xanthocytophaga flavus]MDJ1482996.1 metalloregulator ArsR/SmtB family transcription factor [Xanthocytophaga flavus]MDJ1496305.1 metalloregulator ArsR/SmtB family transcription factor [Xanthocytophaga flavus]MDJ1504233.1 metalloregulator ArsR/SmtB family transcription factor [Xanthocytophaga agilis]
MGLTKTEFFTQEQNQLAAIFKALAHPARIAILQVLIEKDTCICGDIVEELPLAQPTVSQHLKELKSVGLVKGEIEGTSICYCINQETWSQVKHLVDDLFTALSVNQKCCS